MKLVSALLFQSPPHSRKLAGNEFRNLVCSLVFSRRYSSYSFLCRRSIQLPLLLLLWLLFAAVRLTSRSSNTAETRQRKKYAWEETKSDKEIGHEPAYEN